MTSSAIAAAISEATARTAPPEPPGPREPISTPSGMNNAA
jgi:hypothetical protein